MHPKKHPAAAFLLVLAVSMCLPVTVAACPQGGGPRTSLQQVFRPNRPVTASDFGGVMTAGGGWLAVVSKREQHPRGNAFGSTGAVYMYLWTGTEWEHRQTLRPPNAGSGPNFGRAIAFIDRSLFISDPGDPTHGTNVGVVHRLELQAGCWVFAERIESPTSQPAGFGTALAESDGRLFVAALNLPPTSQFPFWGAVYELCNPTGLEWVITEEIRLTRPYNFVLGFGQSIDIDDGTLVVGLVSVPHSLVVFREDASGRWIPRQAIVAPGTSGPDVAFGKSVALDGDTLVVGDPRSSTGSVGQGRVHTYGFEMGTWVLKNTITAGLGPTEHFGTSVSLEGDLLLVGAPDAWVGPTNDHLGRALLFSRNPAGTWTYEADLEAEQLASPVFTSGQFGNVVLLHQGSAFASDRIRPFDHRGAAMAFAVPYGSTTCDALPNSTGQAARIRLYGPLNSRSATPRCDISQLPPDSVVTVCLALTSSTPITMPGSGSSYCLGRDGFAQRSPTPFHGDSNGLASAALDLGGLGGPAMTGLTIGVQAIYRDGLEVNTSNGLFVNPGS